MFVAATLVPNGGRRVRRHVPGADGLLASLPSQPVMRNLCCTPFPRIQRFAKARFEKSIAKGIIRDCNTNTEIQVFTGILMKRRPLIEAIDFQVFSLADFGRHKIWSWKKIQ